MYKESSSISTTQVPHLPTPANYANSTVRAHRGNKTSTQERRFHYRRCTLTVREPEECDNSRATWGGDQRYFQSKPMSTSSIFQHDLHEVHQKDRHRYSQSHLPEPAQKRAPPDNRPASLRRRASGRHMPKHRPKPVGGLRSLHVDSHQSGTHQGT